MDSLAREHLERLFDAFNRRDAAEITELCDERMEFFAMTAEQVGRHQPYVGSEGLRSYLDDVARIWEELLITPREFDQKEDALLVRGRVYLRSHALGIRDMPVGWIWHLSEGRFIRGQVFADPRAAAESFSREDGKAPLLDPDGPRSTTPRR